MASALQTTPLTADVMYSKVQEISAQVRDDQGIIRVVDVMVEVNAGAQ